MAVQQRWLIKKERQRNEFQRTSDNQHSKIGVEDWSMLPQPIRRFAISIGNWLSCSRSYWNSRGTCGQKVKKIKEKLPAKQSKKAEEINRFYESNKKSKFS